MLLSKPAPGTQIKRILFHQVKKPVRETDGWQLHLSCLYQGPARLSTSPCAEQWGRARVPCFYVFTNTMKQTPDIKYSHNVKWNSHFGQAVRDMLSCCEIPCGGASVWEMCSVERRVHWGDLKNIMIGWAKLTGWDRRVWVRESTTCVNVWVAPDKWSWGMDSMAGASGSCLLVRPIPLISLDWILEFPRLSL